MLGDCSVLSLPHTVTYLLTYLLQSYTGVDSTLGVPFVYCWLCWTLTVSFTRQPCPADMEPTDGLDPSGAMIEMICLFIAALGCMTTILRQRLVGRSGYGAQVR